VSKTGILPDTMEMLHYNTHSKTGERSVEASKYRPISLLNVGDKVLEKTAN